LAPARGQPAGEPPAQGAAAPGASGAAQGGGSAPASAVAPAAAGGGAGGRPLFSTAPWSCGPDLSSGSAQAEVSAPAPIPLRVERALGAGRMVGRLSVPGPVFARADKMGGEMDVETVLEGSVELRRDGLVLRADRVVYRIEDDEVKARGNVHLVQRGAQFDGQALDIRVEAQTGQMPDASYRLPARNGSGESKLIEFLSQDNIRLNQATYTTCDPSNPSWWVRAARMDIHEEEQEAVTDGATLYFEGAPVLAWPYYFEFPLGNDRRSGFLSPGFTQSSTVGPIFSFPYYWNIAPNRDYTVTTDYLPQRGLKLDNEFRFLEPNARGYFEYDVLPDDRVVGATRSSLGVLTQYDDTKGLKFNLNYNHVSDDSYLTDFAYNVVSASQEVLPQEASLSYMQPYFNGTFRLSKSQTLITLLSVSDPGPYERVPDLALNFLRPDWHGFDVALATDATRFQHPAVNPCFEPPGSTVSATVLVEPTVPGCYAVTPSLPYTQAWFSQDGSRLIVNPSVSYPLLAPGWFVVPKAQWHYTAYELDPNFNNGATSAIRSLPILSMDSGLIFERPIHWLGRDAHQTLEPRAFYALVPYRDQDTLPNFDSADADFNFAQLFTENTFTGSDRIAQANQITTAVTTRVIDDFTGAERLRVALGQRFYFSPQPVTLPGETPRTGKASDTLFLASAAMGRKWSADTVVDYDSLTSQLAVATFGLRWQPERTKVFNISYRYELANLAGTPTSTNQPQVSLQWPISQRWYGVGAVNYSISDRALAQAVAGFEYKGDCWVARVASSRYAVTLPNSIEITNHYTTHYYLQIEFNGLAGVGFNPLETLQSNIPGYQRINPPPQPSGPFGNYE
jgi:LPS-assembly protein